MHIRVLSICHVSEGAREPASCVERARDAGADGLWVVRGTDREAELLQAGAALAAHAAGLSIGLGGISLPLHHPLRVAEDLAGLDALAHGRLEVALETSASADEAWVEEDVAVLRAAWRRGPIQHEGPRYRYTEIDVHPKPAAPDGPGLWLDGASALHDRRDGSCGWIGAEPGDAFAYLDVAAQRGDTPRIALRVSRPLASFPSGIEGARQHLADSMNGMPGSSSLEADLELVGLFGNAAHSV